MGKIFKVSDMTCQHCVKTIEEELKKLDGVKEVRVSLKRKEVEVRGEVSESKIISSIEKAGYSVLKD